MHLTATQTRHLSAVMQVLTEPLDADALRQRLVGPLALLMNADYVASLVWDAPAARFGRGVCSVSDASHLRAYEAQYQFTDPIAPRLYPRRYPTRVTQVMSQSSLVNSDFFDRFLSPGAMYWGVNLFAHNGLRDVGDLRIWRARAKDNFDDHELDVLRLLYPSLVSALTRAGTTPQVAVVHKLARYESSPAFASHYQLSERQAQVACLAAAGLSDKEIARQVELAYTTVRTHLTQVLRKTGCGNRKDLIGLVCRLNGSVTEKPAGF